MNIGRMEVRAGRPSPEDHEATETPAEGKSTQDTHRGGPCYGSPLSKQPSEHHRVPTRWSFPNPIESRFPLSRGANWERPRTQHRSESGDSPSKVAGPFFFCWTGWPGRLVGLRPARAPAPVDGLLLWEWLSRYRHYRAFSPPPARRAFRKRLCGVRSANIQDQGSLAGHAKHSKAKPGALIKLGLLTAMLGFRCGQEARSSLHSYDFLRRQPLWPARLRW